MNMSYFGRWCLRLNFFDGTKPVSEVEKEGNNDAEKVVFLRFHVLYLLRVTCYQYTAHVRP